jgi:hypothetical protein
VGCAVAQAVSHRLPNAAARVRAQIRSCGICGGQRGAGGRFSLSTELVQESRFIAAKTMRNITFRTTEPRNERVAYFAMLLVFRLY